MADTQVVRPLVPTTIRTEFGDILESEVFQSNMVGRDLTYVPGYSDMRLARDKAIKEVQDGKRKPADVPTLPVRLQWVRSARISGEPDSNKQVQYGTDGYQTVTKEDIGQPWITAMPPGAELIAGGVIKKGDTILMVADGKTAARRAAEQRATTVRLSKHAPASELMRLGSQKPGTDPTFEATPGPQVPVPRSAIKG